MTKPREFLLLGAGFESGNLGVGALAAGALTVAAHAHPQARVALLDYGREATESATVVDGRRIAVPLVNLRFSWKLLLPNNVALLLALSAGSRLFGRAAQAWVIRHNRWLARIAGADLAIAVSGGDSFSDIYGLGRLWYVALPQLLVLSLGVPLCLLPQTVGPFRRRSARILARTILRRAWRVHARDRASLEAARRLCGARTPAAGLHYCPDLAFVLEPHAPAGALPAVSNAQAGAAGRRIRVGVNVSGLLLMGGYDRRNMFGLGLDYGLLIERLVAFFIEIGDADVVLIPHVLGGGDESDIAAVVAMHARLAGRFGARLTAVTDAFDPNEMKHLIGECDFFVGARMHACIAALSQGIPAIGIAYSDKFAGVFESVGAQSLVADPRGQTLEQVIDRVAAAFEQRVQIAAALRARLPAVRLQVLAMLDDLP